MKMDAIYMLYEKHEDYQSPPFSLVTELHNASCGRGAINIMLENENEHVNEFQSIFAM